jgi:hypothetical protein
MQAPVVRAQHSRRAHVNSGVVRTLFVICVVVALVFRKLKRRTSRLARELALLLGALASRENAYPAMPYTQPFAHVKCHEAQTVAWSSIGRLAA